MELMFNEIAGDKTECEIRLYGEVFGGQYGKVKDLKSFKTQNEPNYCPQNDIAFFDIFIDGINIPIMDSIDIFNKYEIKVAPVIFKGLLKDFLQNFDIKDFNSVVSKEFYGLDYIDSLKSTEGVTIRNICIENEPIILKWKKKWALENGRVNIESPIKINTGLEVEHICLDMVNNNRISSYASKITFDELIDPQLISFHVKEILNDTMKDINDEFPPHLNPTIKFKNIKKKIIGKVYPMFKSYIIEIE